jgi:hypothetical protein
MRWSAIRHTRALARRSGGHLVEDGGHDAREPVEREEGERGGGAWDPVRIDGPLQNEGDLASGRARNKVRVDGWTTHKEHGERRDRSSITGSHYVPTPPNHRLNFPSSLSKRWW